VAGFVVRGAAQAQKLRIIANTLRLALLTIGRPCPTQAISKSNWACLRTAATASAVFRLKRAEPRAPALPLRRPARAR
jgi:hypothetical protein